MNENNQLYLKNTDLIKKDKNEDEDENEDNNEQNTELKDTTLKFPDLSKIRTLKTTSDLYTIPLSLRIKISFVIIVINILLFILLQSFPFQITHIFSYFILFFGIGISILYYRQKYIELTVDE